MVWFDWGSLRNKELDAVEANAQHRRHLPEIFVLMTFHPGGGGRKSLLKIKHFFHSGFLRRQAQQLHVSFIHSRRMCRIFSTFQPVRESLYTLSMSILAVISHCGTETRQTAVENNLFWRLNRRWFKNVESERRGWMSKKGRIKDEGGEGLRNGFHWCLVKFTIH